MAAEENHTTEGGTKPSNLDNYISQTVIVTASQIRRPFSCAIGTNGAANEPC